MNKTILITLAGLVILGGVSAAIVLGANDSTDENTSDSQTNESMTIQSSDSMEKESEAAMEPHDSDDSMMMDDDDSMMKKTEKFITLSEYESNTESYEDSTKVYFFHASWCSICKSIEDDIINDPSQIPEGTVFIKTDYDSETDLRKQYGVTTQYTFVQIDNNGGELAQWSATTLDKAIAGIKS